MDEVETNPLYISFAQFSVVFFVVVFICLLLICLLLNRYNVVVVNGNDDMEMWTTSSTTRGTRPSDYNTGKSHVLFPARVGDSVAGLQIPSMTYSPSSTVSHFDQIYCVSNLSDWLIADRVFFAIRCITSLSNKIVTT